MKSVEMLAKDYYKAILKYEKHFKNTEEQFIGFIKEKPEFQSKVEQEIALSIFKAINEMYEKDYAPWRLLKGDIVENLIKIFSSKEDEIMKYIKVSDGLQEILEERAEDELTKFYSKQGLDTDSEEVYNKIVDESITLDLKEEIDSNIFSNDVIEIHSITRCFNDVCKDLYEYYKTQEIEQEVEEIEK